MGVKMAYKSREQEPEGALGSKGRVMQGRDDGLVGKVVCTAMIS